MTVERFNAEVKSKLVRLPGCEIYIPDASAPRTGFRKLDGGRAVYVKFAADTSGYAIVSRAVCRVQKVSPVRWNVVPEAQAGNGAA